MEGMEKVQSLFVKERGGGRKLGRWREGAGGRWVMGRREKIVG